MKHTRFDTYQYFTNIVDPGLVYTEAMANLYADLILRLTDSAMLPFHFQDYVNVIQYEFKDLKRQEGEMKEHNVSLGELEATTLESGTSVLLNYQMYIKLMARDKTSIYILSS